jgi:hypothetical protein
MLTEIAPNIKLVKLRILKALENLSTTIKLPHIVFHEPKSDHSGNHKHRNEKTQHPHILMPGVVVQGHTVLHNEPSQQVALICHMDARAIRAAVRKQAAGIAGRSPHITVECYGGESVDGVLCGVHPV